MNFVLKNQAILLVAVIIFSATTQVRADIDMGSNAINNVATISLNTVVTFGESCPTNGMVARDAIGAVMSCQNGIWKSQQSLYWQEPVQTFAGLPACNTLLAWQTRVVETPTSGSGPRVYTCNGTSWQSLGVDDNGNVTISGTAIINALSGNLQITASAAEGAACTPDGRIAISNQNSGLLLSCQSGVWAKSSSSAGTCPTGSAYHAASGLCYLIAPTSGDIKDAEIYCASKKMVLPSIGQLVALSTALPANNYWSSTVIGASGAYAAVYFHLKAGPAIDSTTWTNIVPYACIKLL